MGAHQGGVPVRSTRTRRDSLSPTRTTPIPAWIAADRSRAENSAAAFLERRASPSSRAISCAASASSTWSRAPAICWLIVRGAHAPAMRYGGAAASIGHAKQTAHRR
jgi:hypothetical protein